MSELYTGIEIASGELLAVEQAEIALDILLEANAAVPALEALEGDDEHLKALRAIVIESRFSPLGEEFTQELGLAFEEADDKDERKEAALVRLFKWLSKTVSDLINKFLAWVDKLIGQAGKYARYFRKVEEKLSKGPKSTFKERTVKHVAFKELVYRAKPIEDLPKQLKEMKEFVETVVGNTFHQKLQKTAEEMGDLLTGRGTSITGSQLNGLGLASTALYGEELDMVPMGKIKGLTRLMPIGDMRIELRDADPVGDIIPVGTFHAVMGDGEGGKEDYSAVDSDELKDIAKSAGDLAEAVLKAKDSSRRYKDIKGISHKAESGRGLRVNGSKDKGKMVEARMLVRNLATVVRNRQALDRATITVALKALSNVKTYCIECGKNLREGIILTPESVMGDNKALPAPSGS